MKTFSLLHGKDRIPGWLIYPFDSILSQDLVLIHERLATSVLPNMEEMADPTALSTATSRNLDASVSTDKVQDMMLLQNQAHNLEDDESSDSAPQVTGKKQSLSDLFTIVSHIFYCNILA